MGSLKSFNAKSAEKVESKRGGHLTKWEAGEIKKAEARENKEKEKLREKIKQQPIKMGKKEAGYKVGERYTDSKLQMRGTLENSVTPSNLDVTNLSKGDLARIRMKMEKQFMGNYNEEKVKGWMRNYVKGLMRVGASQDVIDLFMHVDPERFQIIIDSNEFASIDFIYDAAELEKRMQYIRDVWSEEAGENYTVNFDLDEIRREIEYEAVTYGYTGRHAEKWYIPYKKKRGK